MHTGKVRGKTRSTLDELTGGFSSVEGVRSRIPRRGVRQTRAGVWFRRESAGDAPGSTDVDNLRASVSRLF